jgi:pyridoxamine 5'-phosphate oxidase
MEDFLDLIRNDHHQFDQGKLEDHYDDQPFSLISTWLKEALERNVHEPNAISVSTIGLDGFPDTRVVYIKELLEEGIVFYTNYKSDKGKAIANNNKVHVLFYWPELERQIRISGFVEKVPAEMSDAYFESRPYSSKIGAWASEQSQRIESRQVLEERVKTYTQQFPTEVPRPPHWGGYLVRPVKVEFWQGRPSRLHDRIVFELNDTRWNLYRLNP